MEVDKQLKFKSHERMQVEFISSNVDVMTHDCLSSVALALLSPASSCQAESSFSSLIRIKTWFRNTITHKRLNSILICHVHKQKLSALNVKQIAHSLLKIHLLPVADLRFGGPDALTALSPSQ